MRKIMIALLILLLSILGACTSDKKDKEMDNNKVEETEKDKIDVKKDEEEIIEEATELDFIMMNHWLSQYQDYLDKQPTLGDKEAPIHIIVVADYQCPYCSQWEKEVLPNLKRELVDIGEAQIKFVNLPFISEGSYLAALAGESIYRQNEKAFWEYNEKIFQEKTINKKVILKIAKDLEGIDLTVLEKDIDNETYLSEIEEDEWFSINQKIMSTPSLVINGYSFENAFDMHTIFSFAHDFYEEYDKE